MYAIIGVTGHVGSVVARKLLEEKKKVRAVLRNPQKTGQWADLGAETAIAEMHDASALSKAFQGAQGVFIMTPPLFDSQDPKADHDLMLEAISEAIERSGVKKVVYLSSIGAHLSFGTGAIGKLCDMEQVFSRFTVPMVAIRAAWFMENFLGAVHEATQKGSFSSFLNPLDLPIPMIAAKDIGNLAAELLSEDWNGHRTIEFEGPCTYSANDVAYVLSYELKKNIIPHPIDPKDYADVYSSFGFTSAASQMMAELNDGFNSGHITFEKLGAEHRSGPTYLEDALKNLIRG